MQAKLYAISYDIPSDNRRVKIANALKSYGERVQYSVFECWLTAKELKTLRERLDKLHEAHEDSIRFYPTQDVDILGLGAVSDDTALLIV
jgi:CRISPR-associated protein Cas2